jgi:ribosome-binding ATPase YchF (GTP1/OBG family)
VKTPEAAGVIHTDFTKKFIKAKVCTYNDFVASKGWKGAAEAGKVRVEGREYGVQDGDVVEFMIGS